MSAPARRVLVIGGSAGGLEALTRTVAGLPADLPAAVLAVIHFPTTGVSRLAQILSRSATMPVRQAQDGDMLEEGSIYVGRQDHHLLVGPGRARVARTPRENGHRPAIDPLFRTAARHYHASVTAAVLCGNLDDGSAGLLAVRRTGGVGVVLDPESCAFADMPRNAAATGMPEHVVPVERVAEVLDTVVRERPPMVFPLSKAGATAGEEELSMADQAISWGDDRPGRPSGFTCPECHGVLWEVDDPDMPQFACRIGHRLSAETLLERRSEEIENALWAAVRALEEQASLANRLCERAVGLGHGFSAERFRSRAGESQRQADVLRQAALRSLESAEEAAQA